MFIKIKHNQYGYINIIDKVPKHIKEIVLEDGETIQVRDVRFRTVGDITCTCPVESTAATPEEIVIETLAAEVSERGATRMDDKTSDASMEKRKKDGYF